MELLLVGLMAGHQLKTQLFKIIKIMQLDFKCVVWIFKLIFTLAYFVILTGHKDTFSNDHYKIFFQVWKAIVSLVNPYY